MFLAETKICIGSKFFYLHFVVAIITSFRILIEKNLKSFNFLENILQ